MLGAGLGVRVLEEDVEKIPAVRTGIRLISKKYVPTQSARKEYTSLIEYSKSDVEIVVGDSRGGWTEALDIYFNLLWNTKYRDVKTIILNFDNVRPKGRKIKGFGGTSSGYEPLSSMFESIHNVLQNNDSPTYKIKTIDALDIICLIALNVVSGNVRRSSIMILCAPDDKDIIDAKTNLYKQVNGEWVIDKSILHRQMSNNTVLYKDKPSRELWADQFSKIIYSAEPAFANLAEMIKRNPNAKGLNP
jgi:ribonucleoside-diphosphate reductase alpha chain/ribonucleoside-triphosphate reductase